MELSYDLLSKFAKVTKPEETKKSPTTAYATVVEDETGTIWAKLDGSTNILTPVETTTTVKNNDRVLVEIKDHTATITGNLTTPSVTKDAVDDVVRESEIITKLAANMIDVDKLIANNADILELVSNNIVVRDTVKASVVEASKLIAQKILADDIAAATGYIGDLKTNNITTENIKATTGYIGDLEAVDISAAKIESATGFIGKLEAGDVTAEKIVAQDGKIENLTAAIIDAETGNIKYATIDFSNIGEAAVQKLFSDSGIIRDLIMKDGHVTGELAAVRVRGDSIIANSLQADKLQLLGEDGLYYKLNVNALGETTVSKAPELYGSKLDGSNIIVKTITSDHINVSDLAAFGATIAGMNIRNNALYSGVKDSISNTTPGIFFDSDGQLYLGDSRSYLKFWKQADNSYKLDIAASSIKFTNDQTLSDKLDEITELTGDTATKTETMQQFFQYNAKQGYAIIGLAGGKTLLKLESDRVGFCRSEDEEPSTYFANDVMNAYRGTFSNMLQISDFVFEQDDLGNLNLRSKSRT